MCIIIVEEFRIISETLSEIILLAVFGKRIGQLLGGNDKLHGILSVEMALEFVVLGRLVNVLLLQVLPPLLGIIANRHLSSCHTVFYGSHFSHHVSNGVVQVGSVNQGRIHIHIVCPFVLIEVEPLVKIIGANRIVTID